MVRSREAGPRQLSKHPSRVSGSTPDSTATGLKGPFLVGWKTRAQPGVSGPYKRQPMTPVETLAHAVEKAVAVSMPDFAATPTSGLVRIPGGTFMLGSPETEEERFRDEGPRHEVRVADFYLGRYPVTNEEYARFLAANPGEPEPALWSDRRFNQARQPVVGVSWEEAQRYCAWAGLRLPSEAEWEYACRAGTTTRYHSGDAEADLARVGWYAANSGGQLHAVGEKEPNAFGLYDMHGNVFEWMEDVWHADCRGAPADGAAWLSGEHPARVVRGGSYFFQPRFLRAAYRYAVHADDRVRWLGFRCARAAPSILEPSHGT